MSVSINPDHIHIGRGDIWVGVTVPDPPPVSLNVNGEPADGTFIGATIEGSSIMYRPTTVDVTTQQSPVLVASVINTEDLTIEFSVAELTFENLKRFLLGATGTTEFIKIGGIFFPSTTSLLMIAPKRDGKYVEAMIYKAYFPADRTIPFQREGVTQYRVTARALGVLTRARGDQLGFLHGPGVTGA